jgi:hypothetical protein
MRALSEKWIPHSTRGRLLLLFLAGISIREALAPFTGHPYDFELWVRLGYYVSQGLDPYHVYPAVPGLSFPASGDPTWPGYPPLWPLLLALVYKVYALFGIQNRFLLYFLIKQPLILADLADAYLIFALVRERAGASPAVKALAFWLLCPYTILLSSVWGMFDQLALFFVLLAAYFVSSARRSAPLQALAVVLKLVPVIYLPLLASVQGSKRKMIAYAVAAVGLSALLTLLPYLFFGNWSLPALARVESDVPNKFGDTANYWEVLNNYWAAGNYAVPANVGFLLRVVGLAWIPVVLTATYFCARAVRRSRLQSGALLSALFITLAFFLSKSVITWQFVVYFLGFGLFDYYAFADRQRKILFHAVWLSAFAGVLTNTWFLAIFFEPVSPGLAALGFSLLYGAAFTPARLFSTAALSIAFSAFSLLYLRSLYQELRSEVAAGRAPLPELVAETV